MSHRIDLSSFFSEMSFSESEKQYFVDEVRDVVADVIGEEWTSESKANGKLIICLCSMLKILEGRIVKSGSYEATKIPYFVGHLLSKFINYEAESKVDVWASISDDISQVMSYVNFVTASVVASSLLEKHHRDFHSKPRRRRRWRERSNECDCEACRAGREAASALPPTTFSIIGGIKPDA